MKNPAPNSPEDRLIDELLREQSHGPDEAFLKSIEAAIDKPATSQRMTYSHGRLAMAAAVALTAGTCIWFSYNRHPQATRIVKVESAEQKRTKAALELQALNKAIQDQEDKVEERRKVLATIARTKEGISKGQDSSNFSPAEVDKIANLSYMRDVSLAWVLRPGYGSDGKFPFKYQDSKRGVNATGADMIPPGGLLFPAGAMTNRFKLLSSEVRTELNKSTNVAEQKTWVKVEDQRPNKKGMVYEFPSPLAEERKNEHLKFDRAAVFTLQAPGSNSSEFQVEEFTAFGLPSDSPNKAYFLKSVSPNSVTVEYTAPDGTKKTVDIPKGQLKSGVIPDPGQLARNDSREEAIKRGLDAQDFVDAKREFETDHEQLLALRMKQIQLKSEWGSQITSSEDLASNRKEIVEGGFKKGSMPLAENNRTEAMDATAVKRVFAESAGSNYAIPEQGDDFGQVSTLSSLGGGGMSGGLGRASNDKGFGSGTGKGIGMGFGRTANAMPAEAAAGTGTRMEIPGATRGMIIDRSDLAPEPPSNDRYGKFIDQPWKSPAREPLSTFSIDVDTASYSNVRRMIREGRGIPGDAVRIEECINAFSYHYNTPKAGGPFAVGATLASCPWAPGHQLVRVAIKGREIEKDKRPPTNLVFLIDVSGSMQPADKLPLLKQSMATLINQLDERDQVSMVVYAGNEGVALPTTRLDSEGKAAALNALANLGAGGSTNGGAGIKRAYEMAIKAKLEGGVNRVILATDGDFNVGVTGQDSLVEMVKDRAKSGVFLTVLGFGTGNLNDSMMDAITRDGNGNYFYIDSEREGRKVFLQNLTGTLVTIAKDVKIQVEFNPAKVGGYRLIGYANRVLRNEDFANDKVDAGDIGAGHTVTAFYELTPPGVDGPDKLKYQPAPAAAATDEWMTVKLRYKHPDGDESSKTEFALTGDAASIEKTDADFQFATAVAMFGMKLRGMDEGKDASWDQVLGLANPGLSNDPNEDRAEFVQLVKTLKGRNGEGIVPHPAEVDSGNQKR